MKAWLAALAAGLLSLGSGCAHDYLYAPVGPGTAGGPAVRYPIPPTAPRGELFVTSFGFTEIDSEPGAPATLLHARLAVSNGGPVVWAVDARLQGLAAPGHPAQGAAFVNSDAGAGPVYPIPPGQARVIDLYFALPPPLNQAPSLGGFQLDWHVDAGGQPVEGRTSFQRFEDSGAEGAAHGPYPPYVTVGLGYGVGWWYGPFFPYHRVHPPIIYRYYHPATRTSAGSWRGVPPGQPGLRGTPTPPTGGAWRGTPPSAPSAGGRRGTPPSANSVRAAPAPMSSPRSSPSRSSRGGGGFRGGGRGR